MTTRPAPAQPAPVQRQKHEDTLRLLRLVADGRTDEQAAAAMFISVRTVKTRIRALRERMGAANRPHMIAIAYRTGLLGTAAHTLSAEALLRQLGVMLDTNVLIVPKPAPREDQP